MDKQMDQSRVEKPEGSGKGKDPTRDIIYGAPSLLPALYLQEVTESQLQLQPRLMAAPNRRFHDPDPWPPS